MCCVLRYGNGGRKDGVGCPDITRRARDPSRPTGIDEGEEEEETSLAQAHAFWLVEKPEAEVGMQLWDDCWRVEYEVPDGKKASQSPPVGDLEPLEERKEQSSHHSHFALACIRPSDDKPQTGTGPDAGATFGSHSHPNSRNLLGEPLPSSPPRVALAVAVLGFSDLFSRGSRFESSVLHTPLTAHALVNSRVATRTWNRETQSRHLGAQGSNEPSRKFMAAPNCLPQNSVTDSHLVCRFPLHLESLIQSSTIQQCPRKKKDSRDLTTLAAFPSKFPSIQQLRELYLCFNELAASLTAQTVKFDFDILYACQTPLKMVPSKNQVG
ncbi:uncharacterized protein CLUP02_08158 [Colletotrichum lupini]|uniref:Uncharacterized protein n=1 Tax=Colletotrichum lupini TaxID=145971 RepID=A0A9Q8ST13_9PEZI|nr:uncharacterized protein CLUP02_08158 [Colletotrichum lupini]UQC82668.1 hypothetical protein CLUP02_08158 [Colletotrichum lupini]